MSENLRNKVMKHLADVCNYHKQVCPAGDSDKCPWDIKSCQEISYTDWKDVLFPNSQEIHPLKEINRFARFLANNCRNADRCDIACPFRLRMPDCKKVTEEMWIECLIRSGIKEPKDNYKG